MNFSNNWQHEAIKVLNSNGVILMPTDTVWGITGNALSKQTIKKIRSIKNRPSNKSFIILVGSYEMLLNYIESLNPKLEKFLSSSSRPTTVIYKHPKNVPSELLAKDGTIAIRLVKKTWLKDFINSYNAPLISTSANISGEPTALTLDEVSTSIKDRIDYVIKDKKLFNKNNENSSQIIRLNNNNEIEFIRK